MTLALFLYLVVCNIKHIFGKHTYVKGIRDQIAWCVICIKSPEE